MISQILNSRITWWVAPALSALAVYSAGLRGIFPIPTDDLERLEEKLRENLNNDPVVPWMRLQSQTPKENFFSQSLIGSYTAPEMLLAIQALAPDATDARMTSAIKLASAQLESTTSSIRAGLYGMTQSGQAYSARALTAAKQTDALETGRNLKNMLRLQTSALYIRLGDFSGYFSAYNNCVPVVAAAGSTETLLEIDKTVNETWMTSREIRPTIQLSQIGHEFDKLDPRARPQARYQLIETIIRRSHLLSKQFMEGDLNRNVIASEDSYYGHDSMAPLPWTNGSFKLRDGLNKLRAVSDKWHDSLPKKYTNGLSEKEQLYAAALLLESPYEVKRKATTRRLAATYRELIRSMIYTKIYRERFGVYPGGIDDLQKAGYLAPPGEPTDGSARPDSPQGPLELAHIGPTAQDLEAWLETPYDITIESTESINAGARTRWKLRFSNRQQSEAFDLAMDLKSMQERAGLEVTSWTLYSSKEVSLADIAWKPTDLELLQHWSYLEARDQPGRVYLSRDVETSGPADLPPALALTKQADGALVEMITASRFIKLSAPQIRNLPQHYTLPYYLNMLTVYVPER